MDFSQSLSEWAKDKPLSILQLDPADRAVLKIADERDAIQKKTFTKWLNKHLKKTYTCLHVCYSCPSCCTPGVNRHVDDLFDDLRDGHNLISLLEVLSGELLPRERGRLRFHQLQNVQVALDFLKSRNIRLVNIRPEDIVDGNPKLTLGLIWTIILHFQISDIITGLTDETVTAREALLKWAQRTTERYPGVRITDFTKSWKDGLAFNAILHRNRPDLLDFRSLKARNARDNLEVAFSLAEKEFGITRLLDPEDVDTPEPDEKSLITYISSMYDVFPEPPAYHPFADEEKNRKTEEYTELAKSVQKWIVETLETFKNQKISHSLIDMKNLLLESSKFRSDVLPKQQRNKQRLTTLYKDIQKLGRHTSHVEFSKNLDIDEIEKMWNKLIATLQDRDQKIKDEISRLEKLQRMAEKIGREFKLCDVKLEDIERRIKEEEKRITRLYLLDAKQNCDQIESDFKHIDSMLKSLQKDITSLEDKKYHQVKDLQLRLKICTQKYRALQEIFHTNLLLPLSERSEDKKVIKQKHIFNEKTPEINKNLPSLKEHFDWIEKKQKRINSLEIGEDNQTIKASLEQLRNELKAIEQYNKKINSSVSQKVSKEVCETQYNEEIENLQTAYKELIALVNTRVEEAELLLDFVQSATKALKWMTDKEEIEVTRDWSAKNLNLMELEHHQESLTSDLEKREIQFNTIQNCGENLLSQKHPSSKCIEGYLNKMQDRWSWILQLTLCLEIHLRNAQVYYQFFKETKECEQWIKKAEEKLNTTFSKTVVTVDEGERYLKQMEALKTDLTRYNDIIKDLIQRSNVVIPIRQRKTISSKSTTVISLCSYKHCDTSIVKDCKYGLKEISNKMWKISAPNGKEVVVPGVCFVIPPPDSEAVELSQSLRKRYEEVLRLWSTKQKKLRQSLIFATIKVVKSWDVSQLKSMDVAQRESIMHALNTDAEKLIQEGSESESSLLKLKQEMEQCNVSFQALLKKLNVDETEKSPKSASRKISDTIVGLQNILSEKERFLTKKLIASIVYDLDSLENLVIEHKDFEISLRNLEDQVEDTIQSFKGTNKKPSALQVKYDNLVKTWTKLWDFSNLYIEKLKATEVCITKLNDAIQNVSNIEVKLASSSNMSSKLEDLQNSHDTFLLVFQDDMQVSQVFIDELQQSIGKLKSVLQQIKSKQGSHVDITKLESDAKKLLSRWDRSKAQIVERLRSCGASSELLRSYKNKIEKDNVWISETTVKMNSLKTIRKMTTKEIEMTIEPAMDLYSNISEKGSSIEETNILGSRYIREAKIYDLRLKHYKESLEEEHPSLDASFQKNITDNCGADDVGFELENLNQRYTYLLQEILDYLEDLKEVFTVQQKQKVAVQENYQVCEENAAKLESWMKDIESKVADIGIIQEQILGLQHQIATVKILKEQLESQQILITTCLDQMRQLAQRGLEILNKEEINNLQKNLISLKKHYDCLLNDCDRLLKRLVAAFDELQKFKSETKSLREWMSRAQQQFTKIEAEMGSLSSLEAKSELVRSFSNDVIAHQADLRFIKLAAQKFVNESQDYLKALNTIRTNLPERLPALNSTESEVKLEVQEISTIFHNFLNDVNRLSDNYTLICSKYRLYAETVEKAKLWITDIKKSTKLSLSEHVADEPNAIQSQLNKVKLINMEVVGQSKLVENIYQSAKILTDTLENCNIRPMETKDIENTLHSLQEEYSHLSTMITNRIKELHAALIHSQDIQAGLERILKWLEESELTMKKHNKPISLIMEKLDEQVQENKILKSDISNQKQTIDVLMSTANEKLDTNPNITKKVASKLNDVSQRLDKLSECIVKRSLLLEQVSESVNAFQGMALEFEEWFTATFDRIENTDSVHRTDVDGFSSIIEYILNQKNSRKEDFDQMLKIGRSLISQKNISDTSFIKDKMEVLENQWKSLGESLNEKRQLGKVRSEQLGSYDNLHTKVLDWLMKMERVFEKLEPLALDQSLLRKQSTETVQLVKDHGEYSAVIEKLNHLGLSCDATVRGDGKGKSIKEKESPVKKPSSPTKKSPSKSKSNDNFAVYSTRSQISSQSPVSTISSGFSSSRSSTDNIGGIEGDLSVIQQQLLLVNDRYGLVGTKLSDRNQEISEIMEELKTYFNTIQILSTLVEIKSQQLPKDGFPSSQGVIDNQLKTLKEIQQELLEKQSDLNNIKMNVSNLLGRKKVVKGGIELQEEVFSIERKWASLLANIEEKCLFLKNVKEYQESFKHLQNWLSQKDKMLQVLGPIATEPRMVTSQVQQVQVMRDEFTSQESSVTRFKDLSITIVQYLQKVSISTVKIEEQISSIEAMWTDLSNNLNDREKNLEAASGVSKDFYKNLLELQSKLQQIGDKFDKLEEEEHNNEVLVKKIQELEEHLEKQRSPLTDACSVSEKLCEILSDSSSKSEIKYKVNVLEKSYSTIQKKIDLRKAEIESTLNEDKIFYKACNDIQKWLNETESKFSCSFPISTNLEKLSKEMKDHEARYKDVMNKEHEVYLCLSKGNDMLMKLSGKQEYATTKKKLDMIKKQFEKIKKIAIDKNTTIRSCLENCKSYYSLINMFQPWIESVEEKYKLFGAPSLKREMLVKQVKEVQALRSEMSLHSQEFHSIQRLSEEILLSCDADKETVKKQFDLLNNKWKKLNTDIITKIQFLEDLSQLLLEFEEKYRDLYHIIQRLEDRIHSHATIGEVSCDRMLLDRLEALLKETIEVNEEIKKVKKFSKLIIEKAGEKSDSSEIVKNLNSLQKKHECLQKKLEEKSMSMNSAYKVVSTFMESAKALQSEINSLEESFDELHSVARDRQLLKNQQKEIKEFKLKVTKLKQKYVSSKQICDELVRKDVCDTKTFLEQINSFNKKINRIEERVKEREITLETLITRLENFESTYTETMTEVNSLIKQEKTFEIVAGDVTSIRSQQETFKKMCDSVVKPLNKKIMEVNKLGQGLVQSASSDVDTNKIEGNLEMINHTWNDLQESVNEREKKLDIALLQSGKFQEALSGVQKWLNDTEEMVSNQKSPSFDFKVVKAQVQEQKFLKKMLLDRQNSVISLNALGSELVKTTKMTEIKQAETLMKNITARFEELISTAEERMHSLEETIPVAQEFQTISSSITDWLETIEKKLSTMSSIPVEESRIKTMINDHQVVSEDIGHHKKSLERLNVVSKKLNSMVNPTESDLLMQKVKSINEKFTEIETVNKNIGSQLNEAQKGVTSFFVTYTKVVTHIEEMTTMLASFQLLSIDVDKLNDQLMRLKHLNAKLDEEKKDIAKVINSGEDIMKMASGEDAIQMKEKLDTLNVKLTEVSNKLNERLKTAEESFPLVELFYSSINNLTSWLDSLERSLKSLDNSSLDVQSVTIKKLEEKIPEYRTVLDTINNTSARLYQLSPGEGSNVIENQVTRANHRFEKVCEQIQRKAERIQLTMQRKYDVIGDIDEIFEWFQETERKIIDAEGLTSEPSSLTTLLKEQKALCEDLNGQKSRVRDITTAAKKLMRESSSDDLSFINEKIESLKNRSNTVFHLCQERLSALEQALPLAQHFFEAHSDLGQWLDEVEGEAELLEAPALNSVQIKKQHEKNKDIAQSVQEHKPLVEKLNKTGTALTKLCKEEESDKLEVILESDNSRYNALRKILREHQAALEEALQATSQFSDKLEGILSALTSTADQLNNAEPISAHPDRIQEQINDNKAVLQDLDKRTLTLEAVKKAADDVIVKASKIDEPAVKDIKIKLDRLNDLWVTIQTAAHNRGKSLEEALVAAEKFWEELTSVMNALRELQYNLDAQEPPAVEPAAVHQQREVLEEIKEEITQTKPEVDHCRQAGQNLMQLCGEPDKPEIKKHIEDLDSAWENVTTLYYKREENLIYAMEKAMNYHDTLQTLLEFLDLFEDKFTKFTAVSSDIDSVKNQIKQLKEFKNEVDPHMVEVEALNRQAQELMERTSSDQAVSIREPLIEINKRWDDLLKNIVERQQEMEKVLLKLGQFQHSLEEHLIWITKTDKTLNELKPIHGDPQVIEVILAKHKVIANDIQAHQSSIDAIYRAGHQFMDTDRESEDARHTHNKLQDLKVQWQNLQDKSSERYRELEDALKEAQKFHQDIQDLLMWLNDIDAHFVTSKPVGGLPETATEQLNRFMDLYNEIDSNRYKVENILQQGQNYSKKSSENSTKSLQNNLRTLKQRWDSTLNKANDRKIKLEIALREAIEFHEALQTFVEWLTYAEKYLSNLKPVSRHMKAVLEQIEEHRNFQKELSSHREIMLILDKKGLHLKYFTQKQDQILIKNLLQSVQNRWEKVVSRAAERTRALDHGYKESKEFHDLYAAMSSWLDEAEKILDTSSPIGNDPKKIKKLLSKHKEFQRNLGSKQVLYDGTMKSGRVLKDKSPKQDVPLLQNMLDEIKTRWNKVCSKSVARQRQLEEGLLFSGQFKEAVLALMDWIEKSITQLSTAKPYHGDLDTVTSLIDQHKSFEEEFKNKGLSLDSVCKTAVNLKKQANSSDVESITSQVEELNSKWKIVSDLNLKKITDLQSALQLAEELYKLVHMLLEWLSDAEMKLRFISSLADDEESCVKLIQEHEIFLSELEKQEITKNKALELAHDILKKCHPDGISVIRHWITIMESRWEEISTWSKQREQRLQEHILSLRELFNLLEELLAWLNNAESNLTALEAEQLTEDLPTLDRLIEEHQVFMNELTKKQEDTDKIKKAFSSKRHQSKNLGASQVKERGKDKEKPIRSGTPTNVKSATPSRGQFESEVKHSKAKLLLDKWRIVWILAMERQRRLQDKRNYLLEFDRIKHFNFNDWRLRYLGWLNNKKSRIMDQYKKIDKNNCGKVTKQEFIDGILKSKFETSRLEMEKVADVFDRNGDGFIDNKEYIETLRPEREGGPKTEAEKIQDEVQRQVAACTCVHRFKVYQVGEGKYRFGDSQKLRLVRILRSTVMVRVGGGWVALDEFLVKNDPCRAKGRTNLELREQFILADGVSQSMAPFKPKPSPNSSVSSQSGTNISMPSAGPITKIREKSERSTPMMRKSAENSSDISGPSFSGSDTFSNKSSLSKVSTSLSRLSLKDSSYKSPSRSSSRQGSRPSSRAPSDLSQDGIEDYKTKHKQTVSKNSLTQRSASNSGIVQPKPLVETSKIPSVKKSMKLPINRSPFKRDSESPVKK